MKVLSRSAVASMLLLLAPLVVSAQQKPKAEEIFAKHVAAIGGKDAIMKITSITTKGTFSMPAMGITASAEMWKAVPNRQSMKISIPGLGEILTGFDGTVSWEISPMTGPRVKTGKELETSKDDADFYGAMLFSPERYTSAETVDQVDFGGEKTWHVKTVLKSGRIVNEYFSVATGLKVGSTTTQESPTGLMEISSIESDYKSFGAIKLSTKSEMSSGPQKFVITVTDIQFGELPPTTFALPDQIKALIKP